MATKDSLGDRMKSYEDTFRYSLPPRMPVILRIDGKAFHTYTKGCKRPWDEKLVECMNDTAIELCKRIQGVQLAYVQSDEISLLLNNYEYTDTQSWFDNNLQKMVSISAAVASVTFTMNSWKIWIPAKINPSMDPMSENDFIEPAHFDSRAFVIPREDVNNYFLWRQQDATRNSVQMLARSLYSHKECTDKNNSQLQEMCFQKGKNWNDEPVQHKRGRCIVKTEMKLENKVKMIQLKDGSFGPPPNFNPEVLRRVWVVDNDIPIFSQDRDYIGKFV